MKECYADVSSFASSNSFNFIFLLPGTYIRSALLFFEMLLLQTFLGI